MKGGSQPHLVEADDGHFYVVKPKDNPQHRRILINEWIAAVFLRYLQIATPEVMPVALEPGFLAASPEMAIQRGRSLDPISPGCHFGSRLPGDPAQMAIYDTLPAVLMNKVANLRDLAGLVVFDRWMVNADYRQTIYFRAQVAEPGSVRPGFVMWAIDHGFVFQGNLWSLKAGGGRPGLHHANPLYASLKNWDDLEPWVSRVENFPEEVADQALTTLPREWLGPGEDSELEALLEQLFRLRSRIRADVTDLLGSQPALFPAWSAAGRTTTTAAG